MPRTTGSLPKTQTKAFKLAESGGDIRLVREAFIAYQKARNDFANAVLVSNNIRGYLAIDIMEVLGTGRL